MAIHQISVGIINLVKVRMVVVRDFKINQDYHLISILVEGDPINLDRDLTINKDGELKINKDRDLTINSEGTRLVKTNNHLILRQMTYLVSINNLLIHGDEMILVMVNNLSANQGTGIKILVNKILVDFSKVILDPRIIIKEVLILVINNLTLNISDQ